MKRSALWIIVALAMATDAAPPAQAGTDKKWTHPSTPLDGDARVDAPRVGASRGGTS